MKKEASSGEKVALNVKAFKRLIREYDKITLGFIKKQFKDEFYGYYIMNKRTGFGSTDTCTLCKEAKSLKTLFNPLCMHCVWGPSETGCRDINYEDIYSAQDSEVLYKALRTRIGKMKDKLKELT